MTFVPEIRLTISGDIITVLVKQKYAPRGIIGKAAYRWRIVGCVSLKELRKVETFGTV